MGIIKFRAYQFIVILKTSCKWDTTGIYPESCPVRHFYQQPGEGHGIILMSSFQMSTIL